MTAPSPSDLVSDSSDSLLRFAMRADATLCAGLGLLVAIAADPLSRCGLSATSEWLAGAALVPTAYAVRARGGAGHPHDRRRHRRRERGLRRRGGGGPAGGRVAADWGRRRHHARDHRRARSASPTCSTSGSAVRRDSL